MGIHVHFRGYSRIMSDILTINTYCKRKHIWGMYQTKWRIVVFLVESPFQAIKATFVFVKSILQHVSWFDMVKSQCYQYSS
jgi:hypothetical protein